MDGKPVTATASEAAAVGGGGGGGGVPLIMLALLHHRRAFTAADGLTDLGTFTLHGQVGSASGLLGEVFRRSRDHACMIAKENKTRHFLSALPPLLGQGRESVDGGEGVVVVVKSCGRLPGAFHRRTRFARETKQPSVPLIARAVLVLQRHHTPWIHVPPHLVIFFAFYKRVGPPPSTHAHHLPLSTASVARARAWAQANLAVGDEWSMKVALPPVSFGVGRPVRAEMVDAVNVALDQDVKYEIPENYLRGEGDSELPSVRLFHDDG